MIRIGKPYIDKQNNVARLCADIVLDTASKTMYFEVQAEYGEFLCDEVADAFVVGLLNYALAKGEDITSEAPVSERLLYQLRIYFIKTMPTVRANRYKSIHVYADSYGRKIVSKGAVATSASGGVDSYYTIARHISDVSQRYKLTHLLIANQFNCYLSEADTRNRFEALISNTRPIPENYGLEFICIYTNHNEFLFDGFVQEYSLRICSYSFALQKLIGTYYVSSGVSFKEFGFANHDSDGFDIFNLSMLSTDNLTFYSSGGEIGRTKKIDFISKDLFIQRNLKVCNNDDDRNCCECEKCLRTMLSLDIVGKLNDFAEVFDLVKYKKRKNKYLSTVISGQLEASADLLESMNEYNFNVPLYSFIYGRTIKLWGWKIKERLKKIKLLRKIYFVLKIDFIVYGKEQAIIYRFGTENEIEKVEM